MRHNDREKFARLATKRVSKALKAIQLIGNLSNKSNYDYTPQDVQKIFKALQDEVNLSRRKFELAQRRDGSGSEFKLD
jgi:hypothetical protein